MYENLADIEDQESLSKALEPDSQDKGNMGASKFATVTELPPIEVFHKNNMFIECTDPKKVNLTIGAYRDESSKPWVLPVVKAAREALANDASLNHEYLPGIGLEAFTEEAAKLVLGDDSPALREKRVLSCQALSGTGALRLGAEFMKSALAYSQVYVSRPTWLNHHNIFRSAGFESVHEYTYWDKKKRQINFEGMASDIEQAAKKSVILFHGCAHNPTGIDPTKEQWKELAKICKKNDHLVFFDVAYQGFASGNPDEDAWAIRHFVSEGIELLIAQSFAKNFGLYGERVGNLCMVMSTDKHIAAVKSVLNLLARVNYSNPPAFGARIVAKILKDAELKKQWLECIQKMAGRMKEIRALLRQSVEKLGTPGNWNHITDQIGMFSYTGLTLKQVNHMIDKHCVFLLSDGRISLCGATKGNVEHIAKAIHSAVTTIRDESREPTEDTPKDDKKCAFM